MDGTKREVNLQHLPEYRVLLCRGCRYCVLPQALDRHLKVIHRLSQNERIQHLNRIRGLDLAEVDHVVSPVSDWPPIKGLPVYSGYACQVQDCGYLSITAKRMQAHQKTQHPNNQVKVNEHCRYRRTKLQTFFRGNNLRYFPVARSAADINPQDATR